QSNEQTETKKRKGASKDEGKKLKKPKTEKEKDNGLTLNAAAKTVEILHNKNVKEGMLMLGCVKDVTDFEVTVGLPCCLQGHLSIRNICDSYAKLLTEQLDSADTEDICSLPHLFYPGMLLRCVVHKLDIARGGSPSIQLSINPKLVNKALTSSSLKAGMVLSGCVESVEDHGYIVDIGISGTKAFLPKTTVKDVLDNSVGQYVTCQVEEVKNDGRVVRLSVSPPTVAQAWAESAQGWNLTNLLPGLLVKVTTHGLLLDFLSSFYLDHVRARVLYVESSTRLVGLSLRGYLVQPGTRIETCPVVGDRIGEVVKDCKMSSMHHMSGAMLELPDKTAVFVHRSHLKEANAPANDNRVMAEYEHTCRILDYSPMDQIHFATLRKSVIARRFFRYQDLQAGQIVEVRKDHLRFPTNEESHIKSGMPWGSVTSVLLTVREPLKMKVKVAHRLSDPLCRVLLFPPSLFLYLLSVSHCLLCLCAFQGTVSVLLSHGMVVHLSDHIKGLVPRTHLSDIILKNPEKKYCEGMKVLKAKVLQCDPDKAKMILSFKAAAEVDMPQVDCEVGQKLEARVLKKLVNGLEVAILPGENRAVLPTMHLSDHISNCPLLWESAKEGDDISDLICCNKNKQNITITKKPAVRWTLEEGVVAKDFSEITVGMQLIGWIKNMMSYGVFVEFPYGLIGLAPKSAMSDKFISDTTAVFQLGQTVVAKVTNLDEEKRRFLVTLKITEVALPEGDAQTRLINGLKERRAVTEMLVSRDNSDLHQQLAALSVGEKLKLTVDTVKNSGATLKSDDMAGATIMASKHHVMDVNLTPGQKVTGVVLHVNMLTSCVHVSMLSKLVGKKKSVS
uniref:S1 motif domain-containing protein n=1 Tax=Labrus bergylta TaxID=56723 RepID=A0A3Q3LXH7_9LABR